ncbi:hypothetical protein EDB87DRAFT_1580455 [Lactarius vividus]|nr:hypothetical protein EDB87DRAFT_1580455 [Lactarius vividus]
MTSVQREIDIMGMRKRPCGMKKKKKKKTIVKVDGPAGRLPNQATAEALVSICHSLLTATGDDDEGEEDSHVPKRKRKHRSSPRAKRGAKFNICKIGAHQRLSGTGLDWS